MIRAMPVTLPIAPLAPGTSCVDVVGVGESSADIVALVEAFPRPDTKARATDFHVAAGGQTATALAACARLGWRARYHGLIGEDHWARAIETGLDREGVGIAAIRKSWAPSRVAIVLVDRETGSRTIIEHRDAAHRLDAADIDLAVVTSGRVLIVDATNLEASTAAARAARAAGIPTVVDVERPVPGLDALLAQIDIVITAAAFPAAYTGTVSAEEGLTELARRFRPALVVATQGAAGSLALFEGTFIRTPAPAIVALDTTGAGDAFRGGFVAAWLAHGPGAPVNGLLTYANTVAAMSCQGLGAIGGLPTRQAVDAFVTGRARG